PTLKVPAPLRPLGLIPRGLFLGYGPAHARDLTVLPTRVATNATRGAGRCSAQKKSRSAAEKVRVIKQTHNEYFGRKGRAVSIAARHSWRRPYLGISSDCPLRFLMDSTPHLSP